MVKISSFIDRSSFSFEWIILRSVSIGSSISKLSRSRTERVDLAGLGLRLRDFTDLPDLPDLPDMIELISTV